MPCTPPPPQFVAEPAAWVATEIGVSDGAPGLGAGFRATLGVQVASCTAADEPAALQIAATADVARFGGSGDTGFGFGLEIERSVVSISETSFVLLRGAVSAGNRYTIAGSNRSPAHLDDIEVGVRWRLDALPLVLGADLFDVPTHAGSNTQLGLVLSVGAHL